MRHTVNLPERRSAAAAASSTGAGLPRQIDLTGPYHRRGKSLGRFSEAPVEAEDDRKKSGILGFVLPELGRCSGGLHLPADQFVL